MLIRLLGTAAAEAVPAVFCQCTHCEYARSKGGREIRGRSGTLIDNVLLDMSPDINYYQLRDRLELGAVRDLVITHSHQDHFYFEELYMRVPPFAHLKDPDNIFTVYGNESVGEKIEKLLKDENISKFIKYQPVKVFESFVAGGLKFTPLPAEHDRNQNCYVYFIEGDKKVFLGNDSGYYFDETWDFLKNHKLDLVTLDCTYGTGSYPGSHMGIDTVIKAKERFVAEGIAKAETKFIANHFSHNGILPYDELVEKFSPHGIMPSYDGMAIKLY